MQTYTCSRDILHSRFQYTLFCSKLILWLSKMFVYTSFFIVNFCLLQCSFASLIVKRNVQSASASNEMKQITENIIQDVHMSLKTTENVIEWIVQAIKKLSQNLKLEIGKTLHGYILSASLRIELFGLATGKHFLYPKNNELETKHYIWSKTVCEMLLNLKYMEQLNQIITNASNEIAFNHQCTNELELKNYNSKCFHHFLENVEKYIQSDSVLKKTFTELETEMKKKTVADIMDLNISISSQDIVQQFFSNKRVRSMILTRKFVQHTVKDLSMIFSEKSFNQYTFTLSFFKLASVSNSKLEKLQNIFDQALNETSEQWHLEDFDIKVNENLFRFLAKGLENEPTLKAELTLLQNKFASSTQFDKDMLKINLMPF